MTHESRWPEEPPVLFDGSPFTVYRTSYVQFILYSLAPFPLYPEATFNETQFSISWSPNQSYHKSTIANDIITLMDSLRLGKNNQSPGLKAAYAQAEQIVSP